MAHEMVKGIDTLISANNETPWHGIGTVFAGYPTTEEAKEKSGTMYTVVSSPMKCNVPSVDDPNTMVEIEIPYQKALIRTDHNIVLGTVGEKFTIYQNADMWRLAEEFMGLMSSVGVETAGTLREGRTSWIMLKNKDDYEVVKNDPLNNYFLMRNGFDGKTPISLLFTNIRVVCNNTLTAALKGASETFNLKHTANVEAELKELKQALAASMKYQELFKTGLSVLAKKEMSVDDTKQFVETEIFPLPKNVTVNVSEIMNNGVKIDVDSLKGKGITIRNKNLETFWELYETGKGSDIKGVKNTAYGIFNAFSEMIDHRGNIRVTDQRPDSNEGRFENVMFGAGASKKAEVFTKLLEYAA